MPQKKLRSLAVFGLILVSPLLLCQCGYEIKNAEDLVSVPNAAHRLFVSSQTLTGNLGGVAGADRICQSEAHSVGLDETYRALLASTTATLADRLGSDSRPVYTASTTDAYQVAPSMNALITDLDFHHLQPFWFRYLASGLESGAVEYWAGFDYSGVNNDLGSCDDWTNDSDAQVLVGTNFHSGLRTDNCDSPRSLVCVSL